MPVDPTTIAEAGFAPGYEKRHPLHTDAYERRRLRMEIAKALRGPSSSEYTLPDLPAEFIDPQIERIGLHMRHGHWEQARRTLDDIEQQWLAWQSDQSPLSALPFEERMAAHINRLFLPLRVVNSIEEHCDGTVGQLLEIFPMGLLFSTVIGIESIQSIADALAKAGLITEDESRESVAAWQIGRQARSLGK